MTFTVLVSSQLFCSFGARSKTRVFWQVGAFTNLVLLLVVGVSLLAQLALHRVAVLRDVFGLAPLSMAQLAVAVALGLVTVTVLEVSKLVVTERRRHGATTRSGPEPSTVQSRPS
jgi:Ca2+-transporting ATPase